MGKPYVTAYYGAVAYSGIAAEYGRVRVYYAIVAYIGVTLDSLHGISVLVKLKALCSESDTLINLNSVTYCGSLAYYDARAVVNEEILADARASVDIYTRLLVGKLCHNTRDARYI